MDSFEIALQPPDKKPSAGVFTIGKWSFRTREIVLASVAGVLFIMFLVYAGLYGHARGKSESRPASSKDSMGSSYCTSEPCMKTAAHVISLMNRSIDPCDNFYQYACGNYDQVKPFLSETPSERKVLNDMAAINRRRLEKVLEKPIDSKHEDSSERKAKEFFKSWDDMCTREKLKGLPFLRKIIPYLGGWSVLGTFDNSTWDFNAALKKVRGEFWVDAVYSVMDPWETGSSNIVLRPGGLSTVFPLSWYTQDNDAASKGKNDYKKFITRVATLLARDAHELMDPPLGNASARDALVEEYVNDVFAVESMLADALDKATDGDVAMSVSNLNSYTGNLIDYWDQFSHIFNTAGVTSDTKAVVTKSNYFLGVTRGVNSLPADTKDRMLQNYLIWRVAELFIQELSWEYIQAKRESLAAIKGPQPLPDIHEVCFGNLMFNFYNIMGTLYVQDFVDKENKIKIQEICRHFRETMKSQIDQKSWFDDVTKKYAVAKLDAVLFDMSYPDWMENMTVVDSIYTAMTINISDHFENQLNTKKLWRDLWNRERKDPMPREHQEILTYDTGMNYLEFGNVIVAAAGILQFPIFERTMPHYSSFGSIGSMLGLYLHHVIDEYGQMYDKEGKRLVTSWWTKQSADQYKPLSQCVNKLLENVTLDTVRPIFGFRLPWNDGELTHRTEFIAFVMGIRLAQKAYIDWMASPEREAEKMLPGVDLNEEQMIYLSHTQTYCQSATLRFKFNGEIVNYFAMRQLPEFSEAFNCKKGSRMNPDERCDYK